MSDSLGDSPTNPFSTCCTRPGALPYLFPPGCDAEQLVAALRREGWWGQIAGPHGSGKSTLLQTLRPHLERAGRCLVWHVCHADQTRRPFDRRQTRQWDERTQIVVDGYEQLNWYARWWLQRQCRAQRAGLLVTTHVAHKLPVLWQTPMTLELAQAVVGLLLPPAAHDISIEDVRRAFEAHRHNLRETLFALYDVFEDRQRR
jgi:hypothetical protein